jgi:hypothetical protein
MTGGAVAAPFTVYGCFAVAWFWFCLSSEVLFYYTKLLAVSFGGWFSFAHLVRDESPLMI